VTFDDCHIPSKNKNNENIPIPTIFDNLQILFDGRGR
jgi:hypothetical protein